MKKIEGLNAYGMVLIDRDGKPLTAVNMFFQEDEKITAEQVEASLETFNAKVRAIVLDQPYEDPTHRMAS